MKIADGVHQEPESQLPRRMIIAAGLLAGFAIVGSTMVSFTEIRTRDQIAANERDYLLRSLNDVLPESTYDNEMFTDTIEVIDEELLGTSDPVIVYRARKAGQPIAALLTPVAPKGYGGPIKLLIGITTAGEVTGVRVVSHRETPGLGDVIEIERSDWLLGFDGLSMGNPPLKQWAVKRDGGQFDQFTGATITPRAVVHAVRDALIYFSENSTALFAQPTAAPAEE
ncbi:MAG: electron transport complex subunit RsxG [Gammaproteobacteria bacterium]